MPVVACKCKCGHQWDDLVGGSTIATSDPQCPSCHAKGEVIPCGNAIQAKGYPYPDPTLPMNETQRAEYDGIMETRRQIERDRDQRDDGRMKVIENGPDWSRMDANRPREKKFF